MSRLQVRVALAAVTSVIAIDNGLGRTPPLGWRSWNLYNSRVNQSLLMGVLDAIAQKRDVFGMPTQDSNGVSICDLGFCDVGLDDAWQSCGAGEDGYQYHDHNGNSVVNKTRFPNFKEMTDHAHKLGLTAGWYHNNCICSESKDATQAMYERDVDALVKQFNFDSVKLDGCGKQYDLDTWANLMNATGKPIMIENCHWGATMPNETWCPWNFYRTSGDISASYMSAVTNAQTTVAPAKKGLSKPGCWAYPDMLEVGVPGLNFTESRSHFGLWCIISSPLILSHDVNNDALNAKLWPIISNRQAIAVNQAWAGHSGSPFKESKELIDGQAPAKNGDATSLGEDPKVPKWQIFQKPIGGGSVAVLLMNHGSTPENMELDFSEVPGLACKQCEVRNVWEQANLGQANDVQATVHPHDSLFLVLAPPETALADAFLTI